MPNASYYRKKIKGKIDKTTDEGLLNWVNKMLDKAESYEDLVKYLRSPEGRPQRFTIRNEKKAAYFRKNVNLKTLPGLADQGEELPKLTDELIDYIGKLEKELDSIAQES